MRKALRAVSAVAGCVLLHGCSAGQIHPASIRVTEEVLVAAPQRLGINIGGSTYYDDQQYVANPFLHGGFEKGRQTLVVQVKDATANTITNEYADAADPDRFLGATLEGGTYYIGTGARAGESGRIVRHEPGAERIELEHSGAPLADGDVVWLKGPVVPMATPDAQDPNLERGVGIGDYRLIADEGVSLDYADDGGDGQALRIRFPKQVARLRGGVKHYIRATPAATYRVRFRARSSWPGVDLGVGLQNLGIPGVEEGHQIQLAALRGGSPGPEWQDFEFAGGTTGDVRIGDSFSAVSVVAVANANASEQAEVFIDDLRFEDEYLGTDSGFLKPVVETLKEARVGVLRFYGAASLGSLVEDFTARDTTEASWTFYGLASFYRFNSVSATLDQMLRLTREVGALPWLTVGGANTPEDWRRLISYIAAPADFDADSRRRAEHGRAEPWTSQFDTIYLEVGNEWWNEIFRPYRVYPPERYGELCKTILREVRSHPHFDETKMKLIIGGWAINAHHWNGLIDQTSEGHDLVSIAPYLLHELDAARSVRDKYEPLFADVEGYAAGGGVSTQADLAGNGKGTGLAVYELNTHLTGGGASTETASEICSSVAAGVAVLDQAMSVMSRFGANPINYFTLLERAFRGRAGLWGTTLRDAFGDLRPRPVWHGLRLANQYLIDGPMVRVEVTEAASWYQAENGSVPELDEVPYLHAYAFAPAPEGGKRRANVLVVNRHSSDALAAYITLPFAAPARVRRIELTGERPSDNNEDRERVTLRGPAEVAYLDSVPQSFAPFSATVLQFIEP